MRSDFKNDLKFGNKLQVYQCIDEGKIKVYFGAAIKEISDGEVVLMDARTREEKARIENDYIFALIGGDRPTKIPGVNRHHDSERVSPPLGVF